MRLSQIHRTATSLAALGLLTQMSCGGDATNGPPDGGPEEVTCGAVQSDGWVWVDVAEGTKPVLALDDLGDPHLAFMLEAMDGWVHYARIDQETASEPATVADGYFYGPGGIAAGGGSVFVSYHDHTREDMVLAQQNAGSWTRHPMVNPGHDGWHSSLAVGASGAVHTASIDPSAFMGQGVFYGRYESEAWSIELAAPGDFMYDGGLSLALGDGETPYVAFFDDVAGVAKIARRTGNASWVVEVVEPKGAMLEAGRFPHLVVGSDGTTLHLVYLARATQSSGVIRYATGPFGNLVVRDVAPIDDIQIDMSLGARNIAGVGLTSSEAPIVAFQSRSQTTIARWTGGSFALEELAAPEGVLLRQQVSMAIDAADRLHLAYWQGEMPGQVCYGRSTS